MQANVLFDDVALGSCDGVGNPVGYEDGCDNHAGRCISSV